MKHIIALFLVLISFLSINADTVIQMEPYGGVYRIPCVVNGAKMKFIFDTGASDVCLSMTMAEYLYDNGYIEDDDIIGTGSAQVADGRIVDHIRLILRDIQIGDCHIYNVEASVVDGQNAPLLMGQSAIQKLGSIEINGNTLTLHNGNGDNGISPVELRLTIIQAQRNFQDEKVLECYEILDNLNELDDFELCTYATYLINNGQNQKAIQILNKISNIHEYDNEEDGYDPYALYAFAYSGLENYSKAYKFMKLSNEYHLKSKLQMAEDLQFVGDCCFFMERDKEAYDTYRKAISAYAEAYGVTTDYLFKDSINKLKKNQKSYRSEQMDLLNFRLVRSYPNKTDGLGAMRELARNGNKYAIKYLDDIGGWFY